MKGVVSMTENEGFKTYVVVFKRDNEYIAEIYDDNDMILDMLHHERVNQLMILVSGLVTKLQMGTYEKEEIILKPAIPSPNDRLCDGCINFCNKPILPMHCILYDESIDSLNKAKTCENYYNRG